MELISPNTKIDFLGKSKFAITLSLILIGYSVFIWFDKGDAKYGVDYRGGTELVVKFEGTTTNTEVLRKALKKGGFESVVVQAFDTFEAKNKEYSIRVGQSPDGGSVKDEIKSALEDAAHGKVKVIKHEFVGPTIGKELQRKALIAVMLGLLVILGYVAFRFEFAFALGAVVALFHDVIVCLGLYLMCGRQISVSTLAAALTIVGYSVNDTIIIFDRIREEVYRQKDFDLIELVNGAINSTLSRTLLTSLSTLFSAVTLLIFGGGAIADLSLFLVFGIITGTYSTIFIASPVVLMWERAMTAREKAKHAKAAAG